MSTKSKGCNAERQLVHMFWDNNWASFRAAGSGSTKHDCPDIIAGNHEKKIAIECKATKSKYQYFTKEEIFSLRSFSHLFGAKPYAGVKFNNKEWRFFELKDLKETDKNFCVDKEYADEIGITFEKLINS